MQTCLNIGVMSLKSCQPNSLQGSNIWLFPGDQNADLLPFMGFEPFKLLYRFMFVSLQTSLFSINLLVLHVGLSYIFCQIICMHFSLKQKEKSIKYDDSIGK